MCSLFSCCVIDIYIYTQRRAVVDIYNAKYAASQFHNMFYRGAATAAQCFYIQALIWIFPGIWLLPCMKEVPCTKINTSTTQYEAVHLLLLQIFHNNNPFLNKGMDSINRTAGVLLFWKGIQKVLQPSLGNMNICGIFHSNSSSSVCKDSVILNKVCGFRSSFGPILSLLYYNLF